MIVYLIQVSICWVIFYAIYYLLLRKETFFGLNRAYLVGSLLLGLFIPIVGHLIPENQASEVMVYYNPTLTWSATPEVFSSPTAWGWKDLVFVLYALGVTFMLARLIFGLSRIYRYFHTGDKIPHNGYTLVKNRAKHLPFSFFNFVFISDSVPLQDDLDQVLRHEMVHIHHGHSIDTLLVEILHAFFWVNPILILYKKALKETHEYIADAEVLSYTDKDHYTRLLLAHSSNSGIELMLANQFFHSQIKNRIKMIYHKPSNKLAYLKYLMMLPVLAIVMLSFTKAENPVQSTLERGEATSVQDTIPKQSDKKAEMRKVVDQMPRFPGCETLDGTAAEIEKCAQNLMMKYIFEKITYPEAARKAGIEGMALIKFVVDQSGKITKAEIAKDPGGGTGQEALRVVNSMNQMAEKWVPAMQDGQPVNVQYAIPIMFKLPKEK